MMDQRGADNSGKNLGELKQDLMELAAQLDQENLEYIIRMTRRAVLWAEDRKSGDLPPILAEKEKNL